MKRMHFASVWKIAMLTIMLMVAGRYAHCEPRIGTPLIAGTWYSFSYLDGKTKTMSVELSGANLIAKLDGHTYVLNPSSEGYSGRRYASVAEIQENVTIGLQPISAAMAASAFAQRAMWFDLEIEAQPGRNGTLEFIGLAETFSGRSYLHNGTRVNFIPLTFKVVLTWERKPVLDENFDFASYVENRKGSFDYVFRDLFQKELSGGGLYREAIINGGHGHAYLCINFVPHGVRRKTAMNYLKSHLAELFPFDVHGADGLSPPDALNMGVEYRLTWDDFNLAGARLLEILFTNKVRVTGVNEYSFTFYAIPRKHMLRGTATHGLFEDMGDLYMYQQGRGEADEDLRGIPTVISAGFLWKRFSDHLASGLTKSGIR